MFSIGTIVARNYLAYARVLMASVAKYHPDANRVILVTDGYEAEHIDGCTVITPLDVIQDKSEVRRLAFMYDVIEFATALKPRFLQWMLGHDDQAIFIDPDCWLMHPLNLNDFTNLGTVAALTPHRLTPPPLDGMYPDERLAKTYGIYNLGFIEVGRQALDLLEWWDSRLRRFAGIEPGATLYTDQRWMDLAPAYFDVSVIRDPTYNVAPWNLDERNLIVVRGVPCIDNRPLTFVHYSGVRPGGESALMPRRLLRGDARLWTRPRAHSVFAELCEQYVDALRLKDVNSSSKEPYGLGSYSNGVPISLLARRRYRSSVIRAEAAGRLPPDPPPPSLGERVNSRLDFLERSRFLEASRAGWHVDVERARVAGLRNTWKRTGGLVLRQR